MSCALAQMAYINPVSSGILAGDHENVQMLTRADPNLRCNTLLSSEGGWNAWAGHCVAAAP